MSKKKLKPCPFCASTNLEIGNTHTPSFSVRCNECEAEASGDYFPTPAGQVRSERFHYSAEPDDSGFEADFDALHPEYQRAFTSAVEAWNRRATAAQFDAEQAASDEPTPLDEETVSVIRSFVDRPGETYRGIITRRLGIGFGHALRRAIEESRAAPVTPEALTVEQIRTLNVAAMAAARAEGHESFSIEWWPAFTRHIIEHAFMPEGQTKKQEA